MRLGDGLKAAPTSSIGGVYGRGSLALRASSTWTPFHGLAVATASPCRDLQVGYGIRRSDVKDEFDVDRRASLVPGATVVTADALDPRTRDAHHHSGDVILPRKLPEPIAARARMSVEDYSLPAVLASRRRETSGSRGDDSDEREGVYAALDSPDTRAGQISTRRTSRPDASTGPISYPRVQSPDSAELFHPVAGARAGTPPPVEPPSEPRTPKFPLVLAKAPWQSPLGAAVPELYWFVPAADAGPALSSAAGRMARDPAAAVIIILRTRLMVVLPLVDVGTVVVAR